MTYDPEELVECEKCGKKILCPMEGLCSICFNLENVLTRPICRGCGKEMIPVFDKIAKKFTGHLWKCTCMQDGLVLMIG